MIEHHAAIARSLGEQLELPPGVARGARRRLRDVGRQGLARRARRRRGPDRVPPGACWRSTPRSAHRVGGVDAARELARERGGEQFDPVLADLLRADAEMVLAGLDTVGTWDAVIDAEPALAIMLSGERFDAALVAIANFVDLKSPYTLGHARAVAELAADAAAQLGLGEGEVRTLRRAGLRARPRAAGGLERDLGQARPARRRRMGAGAHAPLPHRAHAAPVRVPGAAGRDRRAAPRAPGRLGLPARPVGRRDLAAGADPRRRRRLPGHARAASPPAGAGAPARRPPSCAPRSRPRAWTPRRSRRCWAPPAIACRAAAAGPPA